MRFSSTVLLIALAGLAFSGGELRAQQPDAEVLVTTSVPGAPPGAVLGAGECPPPTCKVCVSEPKPTTRKVYACKVEEYCLPCCSLFSILRGKCGCEDGHCGEVRERHRLVVRKVDGCDTKQCVVREVLLPAASCEPPCCSKQPISESKP